MTTSLNGKNKIETSSYIRLLALIIIIILVTISNRSFILAYNVNSLLEDIGVLLIMSIGTTFILLIGGMDLSLGANVSCCAVTIAVLMPKLGAGSFLVVVALGTAIGLLNGFCFTRLRIPSFIVTLGTMSIFSSIAMLISGSKSISIKKVDYVNVNWVKFDIWIMPIAFLISLALLLFFILIQKRTVFGKTCYLIGANERAAVIGGARVNKYKILAFASAGLCYALAAIVITSRLKSANPNVGDNYTMMAIAAVAFGGTALSGGRGGLIYTLLGATMIIVITNALVMLGIDIFWQKIVYGVIIIVALCTTVNKTDRALVIK